MAGERLNWFNDSMDDPLIVDGVPQFDGGQFSNWRANLLQPNQSKLLTNCDVDRLGKLRTRRGTIQVGPGIVGAGTLIQGLASYQTASYNYIVAANNGQLWAFDGTNWNLIGTGGVADNDQIYIARLGFINAVAGYSIGDTVLTVNGITGIVGVGEKLYFINTLRTDYFEYTINAHTETTGNTTQITLEEPGLVFAVENGWGFIVLRPALVNHALGYAGGWSGATGIDIDGYTGVVNNGEYFVVKSENVNHVVTSHTETAGNTPHINFAATNLQTDYTAESTTNLIVFAQGNEL
jgi:hypothetical protein